MNDNSKQLIEIQKSFQKNDTQNEESLNNLKDMTTNDDAIFIDDSSEKITVA